MGGSGASLRFPLPLCLPLEYLTAPCIVTANNTRTNELYLIFWSSPRGLSVARRLSVCPVSVTRHNNGLKTTRGMFRSLFWYSG